MTRLRQDLVYAWRTCRKAPGFTATAILVLAIGIGANTAIFTIVRELLLRPLPGRAGELMGLYSRDSTRPDSYRAFSYPNYVDLRASEVFESLLAHTMTMVGTPAGEMTRRTVATVVSSNYFDVLGVRLAAGRTFTADEERPGAMAPVVIVPYARWKAEHLDPSFLGRKVRINATDFTVVGVAPEGFTGPMALLAPDFYLPLGMFDTVVTDVFRNDRSGLGHRDNHALIVAGTLRAGMSGEIVAARLDALSRQMADAYPAENRNQALSVHPLSRVALSTVPQTNGPLRAITVLLMSLSAVVLVIACLNIANMLLARGTARGREVSLRLALGANRTGIVRQLLTESFVLALAGAAGGLLVGYWATRALTMSMIAVAPFTVTFSPTPDLMVLGATIAFAALATFAFGLGPALRLSRRDLVSGLKEGTNDGAPVGRRFSARNVMVVGQVALSLALLTVGGVFARTAVEASRRTPGYDYDRLLVAHLDVALASLDESRGRAAYRAVLDRVRSAPGVEAVTMASTVPFGDVSEGRSVERVAASTPDGDAPFARTYRVIGADYFRALGLPMVRGREFTRAEEESSDAPRVAIIDEALARSLFGTEDPLGQSIRFARPAGEPESARGEPMLVVGIAPPMREELLDRSPKPHVYVPAGHYYRSGMHVQVRLHPGADQMAALEQLRRDIRAVDDRLPVLTVATMQGFHDRGLELWVLRTGARLFSILGGLALVLAVVGVYAVKSYVVSRRTREIGIRMALGASRGSVVALVLRDGLWLTGAGVALGFPLAVLASMALKGVFVDVGGFDAVVVGGAALMLALSATAATTLPARRAAGVEPLTALRTE